MIEEVGWGWQGREVCVSGEKTTRKFIEDFYVELHYANYRVEDTSLTLFIQMTPECQI